MSMMDWKTTELEEFISASLKVYSDQVGRTIKINYNANLLGACEASFFIMPEDPFFDLMMRYATLAMSVCSFRSA